MSQHPWKASRGHPLLPPGSRARCPTGDEKVKAVCPGSGAPSALRPSARKPRRVTSCSVWSAARARSVLTSKAARAASEGNDSPVAVHATVSRCLLWPAEAFGAICSLRAVIEVPSGTCSTSVTLPKHCAAPCRRRMVGPYAPWPMRPTILSLYRKIGVGRIGTVLLNSSWI